MHSIHGRAQAIATGLAASRPDLSVWVITGDGDALSIGGNHLIHALRRNVNIKILLFNNRIYGLTKGQYSPTSERGKVTKSTPFGSLDHPFNPLSLALGADASFAARTIDSDRRHLTSVLRASGRPPGCRLHRDLPELPPSSTTTRSPRSRRPARQAERLIKLEHGEPVRFADGTRGIRIGPHGELEAAEVAEVAAAEGPGKSDTADGPGHADHSRRAPHRPVLRVRAITAGHGGLPAHPGRGLPSGRAGRATTS